MVVRRKVVLGVVVLLCVAAIGYVMYTKGDKEADTKAQTDDKPKSDSKAMSFGFIGVLVLIAVCVVVAFVVYIRSTTFEPQDEQHQKGIQKVIPGELDPRLDPKSPYFNPAYAHLADSAMRKDPTGEFPVFVDDDGNEYRAF